MEERPRRAAPRWPADLVEVPLQVQDDPVGLVITVDDQAHAWDRSHGQVRPLPDFDRKVPSSAREVLSPGGRHVFFAREGWDPDETVPHLERRTALGIYRYTFATGQVQRATFEPPPGAMQSTDFGASPDGTQLLVTQGWVAQEPGRTTGPGQPPAWHLARTTLWLADFAGTPPRELVTISGYRVRDVDDLPVQWSPDGTKIAVSIAYWLGEQRGSHCRVLILDAATGAQVDHVDDVTLTGSASWSPSCRRLLTTDQMGVVWTYDLDDQRRHTVAALPGPQQDYWVSGAERPLGFADDEHLLLGAQRKGTMTISTVHQHTGETRALVRWTGGLYMYPATTPMPPGYWDQGPAQP